MILNNEQARLRAAYIDGMLRSIYLQGGPTQRNFAALPFQRDLAALLASHVELAERLRIAEESAEYWEGRHAAKSLVLSGDAMVACELMSSQVAAQAERIKELERTIIVYGCHTWDCARSRHHLMPIPDCSRGWTDALAGVAGRDTGQGK